MLDLMESPLVRLIKRSPRIVVLGLVAYIAASFVLGLSESVVVTSGGPPDSFANCYDCLRSLAFTTNGEGWAVGPESFLLHYSAGRWTWIHGPGPIDFYRSAVTLLSPTEGWAVGERILHFHEGHWQTTFTFQPLAARSFSAISMATPDDGWAVGADWSHPGKYGGEYYGLLLHYAHGTWIELPLIPHVALRSVALVSPDEGWAVGTLYRDDGSEGAALVHLLHGQWTLAPAPVDAPLDRVAMRTPTDGWVLGADDGYGSNVYLHFHNGAWSRVQGPDGYYIRDLALSGAADGWAAADRVDASGHLSGASVLHLDGDQWAAEDIPALNSAASVAVASDGTPWLLGRAPNAFDPKGSHGLLLRRSGGRWTPVELTREPPPWAPLGPLLPVSLVLSGILCLGFGYGLFKIARLRLEKRARKLRLLVIVAYLFALALVIEVIQVAAAIYPFNLTALAPLLPAIFIAVACYPILQLAWVAGGPIIRGARAARARHTDS